MNGSPPQSVFVGVSGASGAPYAARLVQALAAAGCSLQLSISESGVLVLQHELGLPARDARRGHGGVPRARRRDGARSSRPTISARCRRAEAAPRTPSSSARAPCRRRRTSLWAPRARSCTAPPTWRSRSGARSSSSRARRRSRRSTCAGCSSSRRPAPSCFRPCRASTLVRSRCRTRSTTSPARCSRALGFEQDLFPPWDGGRALMAPRRPARGSGDLPIDRDPSRIEAMFGDIAARYDLMNRLMTVGLDGRWRRMAAGEARLTPGDEASGRLLRHRRPHLQPRGRLSLAARSPGSTSRRRCLSARGEKAAARKSRGLPVAARVRRRRPARTAVRGRPLRRRHRRLGRAQRAGRAQGVPRDGAGHPSRRPRCVPRVDAGAGRPRASASTTSGWAASCRCSAGS